MSEKKMKLQEMFEDLRSNEMHLQLIQLLVGQPVSYSMEALEQIEDAINKKYPEGHTPMPTTLIPFGFYIGEYIQQLIPGSKWVFPTESIWDAAVEFPAASQDQQGEQGVGRVMPFVRVDKFWNDRTDGLCVFVRMIVMMAYGSMPNAKPGEWVELPNGDRFRYMAAENYNK